MARPLPQYADAFPLNTFRLVGDAAADGLIRELYATLSPKEVGEIYAYLLNHMGKLDYQRFPKVMQVYFEQHHHLPEWADLEQIQLAEEMFLHSGPEVAISLLFRALPIGYSSANVVKVLTSTGYLASDKKTGSAKRLMETTQFIIDVLSEGALRPGQKGIDSVLKVRFLHAMVRHHLQKRGWEHDRYGTPINQEDMAGTIFTFSASAIIGMEKMGIQLSQKAKNAWTHFWSVVGYIIGVKDEINPQEFSIAHNMYLTLLHDQAAPSEDGRLLTATLAGFVKDILRVPSLPRLQEHLIRFLIDEDQLSDMLGLSSPTGVGEKASLSILTGSIQALNQNKGNFMADAIARPVNQVMAHRLIAYFEGEFNLRLEIPDKIRSSWGLKG